MAQVIIRNLDEEVVARLKRRARGNERSLEAELRVILEEQARGGAVVGEPAPSYGVPKPAKASSIRYPARAGTAFEAVKPVRLKGRPASRLLVEERR